MNKASSLKKTATQPASSPKTSGLAQKYLKRTVSCTILGNNNLDKCTYDWFILFLTKPVGTKILRLINSLQKRKWELSVI